MKNLIHTITTCFAIYSAGALLGYYTGTYTIEAYTQTMVDITLGVCTMAGAIVLGLIAISGED